MARIFISYRREDEPGYALALARDLTVHFGADEVFKDVDTLRPGTDFVERIDEAVASAQVLIALIGREWMGTDSQGLSRIHQPKDFVRLEVGSALKRNIRVVPVLVRDARMPEEGELPEDLSALTRRHALELDDAMWAAGVERLVSTIKRCMAEPQTTQPESETRSSATLNQEGVTSPKQPASQSALIDAGRDHRQASRYDEALASLEQALTLDPKSVEAWSERGWTYRELKRHDEALASFEQVAMLAPRSAAALCDRAWGYAGVGRKDEALASFEHALRIDAKLAPALRGRGFAFLTLGRYEEALASFEQALAQYPEDVLALTGRGLAFEKMWRFDEALASYEQALKLSPDDSDALARARVLKGSGRSD